MERTPWVTACSRSQPGNRILADLPPSSSDTRLMVLAASRLTDSPARVEPVRDTTSMRGSLDSKGPTAAPSPYTILKTPAGTPASSIIRVSRLADRGANSLGLSTMVQPAAMAGATLHMTWFMGQFQGVIRAQTPAASRRISDWPAVSSNGNSRAMPRAVFKWARPMGACTLLAREMGAPISWLMASAISGRWA